jgi:5-methylcytosine-specific restriction endonuclease McrA
MILALKRNAYANELSTCVDLAGALLEHLAACSGPPVDPAALATSVPHGAWLSERLSTEIDDLVKRTTPAERQALAEAYTNDVEWDRNVDQPAFRFEYPGLPETVRDPAGKLLAAFYDKLLKSGFKLATSDGSSLVLDRKRLEQGFFARNTVRSCPACMEVSIERGAHGRSSPSSCDHFLPKSLYGPLAIHPQNLVFVCSDCNERRKGRRDPLTAASGPQAEQERTSAGALKNSYLPYKRSALGDLKLVFERHRVALTADTNEALVRLAALDRLYDLSGTWSDVLPRAERELFTWLESLPTARSTTAVLDRAERLGAGTPEELEPGQYLRGRYASHLRAAHLETLKKEWQQRSREERLCSVIYETPTAS